MDKYNALIIGAGPIGNRVAYRLANLGYKVMVIEKNERIGSNVCCTGIISRECVEHFGIDKSCILRSASSAKLFPPSGEPIRISKGEVQAYIVDRAMFDRLLAEKAQSKGAKYLLNSYVNDISVFGNEVKVHVDGRNGEISLEGKVAVIASGFASKLASRLGLGNMEEFIVGAQTEVQTKGIDEVEIYFSQDTAPGFFAWLVPISRNRARAGLSAQEKPGEHLREFLTQLTSQGKIQESRHNISYGGIPLKPLPRTYGNRVLVVGDAAGQVKPTTGGGIYFGLLCADVASQTLRQALSADDLSFAGLSQYEELWKGKLEKELRVDYFARRLYNRLSDKKINSIFELAGNNHVHETLLDSPNLSFDWHGQLILEGLKSLDMWRQLIGKHNLGHIWRAFKF